MSFQKPILALYFILFTGIAHSQEKKIDTNTTGIWKDWYKNGGCRKEGIWRYYNKKGDLIKTEVYKNGILKQ